ncbi:hypothetical protein JD844_009671 [Phrynosoma platyrhinos]|uniref:Right handed beta helix domain-containing protein n=1 Tax=Phrynosoma platyrhinos TaxID=52577 RepID=A0ABQ7TFM5_PHRPL|nr:hypothetical protein JD844_009671 [Phrynosoma platyrhinos]
MEFAMRIVMEDSSQAVASRAWKIEHIAWQSLMLAMGNNMPVRFLKAAVIDNKGRAAKFDLWGRCHSQFPGSTQEHSAVAAAGLYVKSSEALNIIGNAIHANYDCGVAVFQSSQLTRVANNSISCNSLGGVLVEAECRVELRGNGIYDNSSHGVTSKGDGVITENDILGNQGCGLKLCQSADMKVTKNRIHSFRGYGIEMLDQTKALVQDNLIFQGKSKKTILQQVASTEGCVLQDNKLLAFKKRHWSFNEWIHVFSSRSDVAWTLENPPARPHIEGSSRGMLTSGNSQKGSNMTARIAARVDGGCHNNGSIFCTIL